MAHQEWAGSMKFTYGLVSVDKNSPLGCGSYGAVYKAKCDELHCAAKVIHEALLINNPSGSMQGEGRIVDKFYQECHFLSELKHPNIVQFLGTHIDQEEESIGQPSVMLLMELMDESLTHHLENSTTPLPLHIEIDLCYDIALAVAYLHSNHIIHRDLTGNNVLLYAGKRAKVTDFGVSKLIDPNILQRSSMSLCPGTTVYMPPEALEEISSPHYTMKLDCFSYGVLCIQIFTRQFPNPTSRYEVINSEDASQRIRAVVSETTRRGEHISMVNNDHIFLPTALECLSDNERDRPSSQEMCHRLVLLKEEAEYIDSRDHGICSPEPAHQVDRSAIQRLERELQESRTHCDHLQGELDSLQDGHRMEITRKNNQIQQQRGRIASAEQQHYLKDQECQQKDHEINRWKDQFNSLKIQLLSLEQAVRDRDCTIETLETQNGRLHQELSLKSHLLKEFQAKKEVISNVKLVWREGPKACTQLRREPDAVVNGDMIYFKYFWGISIFAHNITHQSWVELPSCPVSSFSMAVLDNMLTVIGGKSTDLEPVSTLISYQNKKWVSVFPDMRIKRYWTISTKWESFLIVIGGEGKDRRILSDVEVLNLDSQQWSFACSLPRPIDSATAAICGDHLYIGGGSQPETARYVTVCSLPGILQDLRKEQYSLNAALSLQRTWDQIDDLPYLKTTLVAVDNYLFAVGGKDRVDQPTSAVCVFNALAKKWEKIGDMIYARSSCFAVCYSNNELMVVGGINKTLEPDRAIRLVEFGHVLVH